MYRNVDAVLSKSFNILEDRDWSAIEGICIFGIGGC
jgi:hypothetical protein